MHSLREINRQAREWVRNPADVSDAAVYAAFVSWLAQGPQYLRAYQRAKQALAERRALQRVRLANLGASSRRRVNSLTFGMNLFMWMVFAMGVAALLLLIRLGMMELPPADGFKALALQLLPKTLPICLIIGTAFLVVIPMVRHFQRAIESASGLGSAVAIGDRKLAARVIWKIVAARERSACGRIPPVEVGVQAPTISANIRMGARNDAERGAG
jgi:hypothetical protein